jgi:flagellar export protein FliJ
MAVFKFRLDAVLRARERAKDERRWELRALNETRERMESELRKLKQELGDATEMLARPEGAFFSAIEIKLLGEHGERISKRIQIKQAELAKFDPLLIAKRAELVEAMRAVKSLEQLRKRQTEKFRRDEDAKQQKFLDEVAQRKFVGAESRKKIPR